MTASCDTEMRPRAAERRRLSKRPLLRALVSSCLLIGAALSPAGAVAPAAAASQLILTRTDVSPAAVQANGASYFPSADSTGRFVAFQSRATNLAAGIASASGIVVRDTQTGSVTVLSLGLAGAAANGDCVAPSMSADGRYVVFASIADNLVAGDDNRAWDVFVGDILSGDLALVSTSTLGGVAGGDSFAPVISADGRFVAFVSDAADIVAGGTGAHAQVYVRDLATRTTRLVSAGIGGVEGDADSSAPAIDADGTRIAFVSEATNLVAGAANGLGQVYARDAVSATTELVSASTTGQTGNLASYAPAIDADGSRIAFDSLASNLVAGDTNAARDVFLRDVSAKTTALVSVSASGVQGDAESRDAAISSDGVKVLFSSHASRLAPGDPGGVADVLLADSSTGTVTRVSSRADGGQADGSSSGARFSADGTRVVFHSEASDLVSGDTNGVADVFSAEWVAVADPTTPPAVPGQRTFDRVSGADRYATAVETSKRAFPDGSGVVVLASGENWPDALGGSALAGALGGPLLLTRPSTLPEVVRQELTRLGTRRVVILGGTTSVSPAVEAALKGRFGASGVTRLGGANRYDTAALIAGEVVRVKGAAFDGTVLVATGGNYPDALAGSPVAAAAGRPIVLVNPKTGGFALPAGAKRAAILGGPASVSSAVESRLRSALGSGSVVRLGGANRYQAAQTIGQWGVSDAHLSWSGVTLATGEKFTDALSGGVMAARLGSVVLLTPGASLSPYAKAPLTSNAGAIYRVYVVGGPSSVSPNVLTQIKRAVGE